MPDIKINESLNYNFLDYVFGDTFDFLLSFFSDDAGTIPEDVSASTFFMDIQAKNNRNGFCTISKETLAIASGIKLGPSSNQISISKILISPPGAYEQSIRRIFPNGDIKTIESGNLKIEPKV